MESVLKLVQDWNPVIAAVVGTFALIATRTKNESDNKIVDFLLKAVNFLGANFGKAKNGPAA